MRVCVCKELSALWVGNQIFRFNKEKNLFVPVFQQRLHIIAWATNFYTDDYCQINSFKFTSFAAAFFFLPANRRVCSFLLLSITLSISHLLYCSIRDKTISNKYLYNLQFLNLRVKKWRILLRAEKKRSNIFHNYFDIIRRNFSGN